MVNKLKIYFNSTLILTAIAILLCTANLIWAFDSDILFFKNDSLSSYIYNALFTLSTIWVLSSLVLVPKNALPTDDGFIVKTRSWTLLFVAFAFASTSVLFLISLAFTFMPYQPLVCLFGMVCSLFSMVYFLNHWFGAKFSQNYKAMYGFSVILMALFLIVLFYFDTKIAMNSPIKTSVQFALLAISVYMLFEIRFLISRAMPRAYFAISLLTLFFTATCSISGLAAFALRIFQDPAYLAIYFICFAFSLFLIYRISSFISNLSHTEEIKSAES